MASALKRKRGPGEDVDTPKRSKSVKEISNPLPTPQIAQVTGWDAAFNPPAQTKELITTNGINGDASYSQERPTSPDALDYEEYENLLRTEEQSSQKSRKSKKPTKQPEGRQTKEERKLLKKVLATNDSNTWKLSEPIGGRQINADPVFTADEK
jgi:NET1-associated nuclear protein 1 (U3 small nucleolar RNA-associated protein 17)